MNKLLICGVSGLFGLNAALQCGERFNVTGCYLAHPVVLEGVDAFCLDLTDRRAVISCLGRLHPDVILHTAGLTNVDACEAQPTLAYQLNVDAARHVAQIARQTGAQLIHISTDHLFSGRDAMVTETAEPQPLNEYARTKFEAERVVRELCPDVLIIRTNFFGWGTSIRASFTDWILRSLANGQVLNMFTDIFFTPILINTLIDAILELQRQGARGIFNVAGGERLSKYEFGVQVARRYGYPETRIRPCSVESFPLKAPRPRDMSLSTAKATGMLGRPLPTVAQSIEVLRTLQQQGWPELLEVAVRDGARLLVFAVSST
jgi:dTDP-4-dehydrorhamnose reductase